MSSPSKSRAHKRQVLATGLEARKERKRLEELESEFRARRAQSSPSVASSSRHRIYSEDEAATEATETANEEETYAPEYDIVVEDEAEMSAAEQGNLDHLQELQTYMSEPQGERPSSPVPIGMAESPKKTAKAKYAKAGVAARSKKTHSVLQERNGSATQTHSGALAKAREKAKEGPTKKHTKDDGSSAPQRKVVEKVPSSFHRQQSVDERDGQDDGLRRGSRYRYKPLEYWRGEKARFGRPSLPKLTDNVGDETIDGDAFEDHFAGVIPPVAVLKEIIRVPREEGEGTFSGMKIRRDRSGDQAKQPVSKKPRRHDQPASHELDPTQPSHHAESGWDDGTEMKATVWDAESQGDTEMRESGPALKIACVC